MSGTKIEKQIQYNIRLFCRRRVVLQYQEKNIMIDVITKIILFSGCVIVPVVLTMMLISKIVNKKDSTEEQ